MKKSLSHMVTGGVVAVLVVVVTALPSIAQLGPRVINTGGSCFNASFIDPHLTNSRCNLVQYDFDGCPGEGGEVYFRLRSGPGSVDSASGVWKWENIPASASGQTFEVVAQVGEVGHGWGSWVIMTVTILPDVSPQITSGCAMSTILTDLVKTTQMAVTGSGCDPITWQTHLLLGNNSAQVSIDGNGMASFSTTVPDLYVVRVIATSGAASDTCDHTYLVHGGGTCCSGKRGNINALGATDLADLAILVQYLTEQYVVLPCYDAANFNGLGGIDLADLSSMVSYLTSGTPAPANCP